MCVCVCPLGKSGRHLTSLRPKGGTAITSGAKVIHPAWTRSGLGRLFSEFSARLTATTLPAGRKSRREEIQRESTVCTRSCARVCTVVHLIFGISFFPVCSSVHLILPPVPSKCFPEAPYGEMMMNSEISRISTAPGTRSNQTQLGPG